MKLTSIVLTLLILSGTVMSRFTPAQAQDVEVVRGIVQTFLNQTLGRESVLIQYTYEGGSWADENLGCEPAAGGIAAPGVVPGYRWLFLMDDGIRYAVNSNLDGSIAVFCPDLSQIDITYSTYAGQFFTVDHPNLWSAQRTSDTEVNFAFRGQQACNLPGMQVLIFPDYESAAAALDQKIPPESIKTPLLDFGINQLEGLTVTYNTPCDAIQRTWRGTVIRAASGGGILLSQWSSEITFPIWDGVFRQILNTFQAGEIPASLQPVVEATPLPANVVLPAPPVAPVVDITTFPLAHVFVGDIFIGRSNDLPGINLTYDGTIQRDRLRLSPNGAQLAYVENGTRLYLVADITTGAHTTITEQIANLPPAWSADGTQLIYAIAADNVENLAVKTRAGDGTEQALGEIPFNATCDRASNYVVDQLYWTETGLSGNALIFEMLADGRILYSPDCSGEGLTLWNPADNTLADLGTDLRRAHLSPNRGKVAAIGEGGLVVIDLATLESTPFTTTQPPDQLAWDVTGTQIFYSTITRQEPVTWNDPVTQAQIEATFGVFPMESRLEKVRIFQLDTQNLADVQRWEGDGFAVGRMIGAPDGSGIFFTLIPSDRAWLAAYVNGEPMANINISIPETQLFWLPAEGGTAQLLAITAQPVFGQ